MLRGKTDTSTIHSYRYKKHQRTKYYLCRCVWTDGRKFYWRIDVFSNFIDVYRTYIRIDLTYDPVKRCSFTSRDLIIHEDFKRLKNDYVEVSVSVGDTLQSKVSTDDLNNISEDDPKCRNKYICSNILPVSGCSNIETNSDTDLTLQISGKNTEPVTAIMCSIVLHPTI